MDLEKRFVVWLFALLSTSSLLYLVLDSRRSAESLALVLSLTLAVGVISAAVAHYLLFKPIRRLVTMAQAVGAGDFSKRLRFQRKDDIGSIALEMDTMCDQLEAAQAASEAHIAALEQLRHSDRVATLGRLASSVAHELGNPLNVIELRAQLITSGDLVRLDQAQQNALVIVEQVRRMARIIGEILSFARMQPAKIMRLELQGVLRKSIALCEHTSKRQKVSLVLEAPSASIMVDGDPDTLLQVIVNLVSNAVQSMPSGGDVRIVLSSERRTALHDPEGTPHEYACVEIADRGVGISEVALAKVFQPFFSTRSAEGGTGLGLSVAQGIANDHDGWITVTSEVGVGSSFKVYLPTHAGRVSAAGQQRDQ